MDVELPSGEIVVAHSTNTGSLAGCLKEGAPTLIRKSPNPDRKLAWSWIMIRPGRSWVGVDTSLAVPLVEEAMDRGELPELDGYERRTREVKYGRTGESRIDILLSRGGEPSPGKLTPRTPYVGDERMYVEVKNTTLTVERDGRRVGAFPDAVTERGLKHLHELRDVVKQGHRAAVVFCAQRSDVTEFTTADEIHAEYGKVFRKARKEGVEFYALAGTLGPKRAALTKRLEIVE